MHQNLSSILRKHENNNTRSHVEYTRPCYADQSRLYSHGHMVTMETAYHAMWLVV
jgi:hypothetical protein